LAENILLTDLLNTNKDAFKAEITNTPTVLNANLNISLSALRDALLGADSKTFSDVITQLNTMSNSKTLADIVTKLDELKTEIDLIKNTDGIKKITDGIVNKNSSGTEIFTDANAGSVKLTGSILAKGQNIPTVTTKTVLVSDTLVLDVSESYVTDSYNLSDNRVVGLFVVGSAVGASAYLECSVDNINFYATAAISTITNVSRSDTAIFYSPYVRLKIVNGANANDVTFSFNMVTA